MERDVRKLRFVVEHYPQLQGLRQAVGGLSFVACFGSFALAGSPGGTLGLLITVAGMFAISISGDRLVSRYYQSHFGRVVPPSPRPTSFWWPVLIGAGSAIVANVFRIGQTAAICAILGALSLWIVRRDWPFRAHYLIGTCAAFAAFEYAISHGGSDNQTIAIAFVILGAAWIVVGLLDHRLLTSLVYPRSHVVASEVDS